MGSVSARHVFRLGVGELKNSVIPSIPCFITTRKLSGSTRKVEYNFLSRNCGLKVSNICLGTVTFGKNPLLGAQTTGEEDSHKILDKFSELGGNFIDTANVYSLGRSEEIIGSWMKNRCNRDKMVIATKCRLPMEQDNPNGEGLSRKHIIKEIEESLKRLQTDYIDIYQPHYWDEGTPLKEVLSTMNDMVRSGKVRYVGGSNLTGWQLQKTVDLNHYLGYNPWVTLQQEYNLLERKGEPEPLEVCKREGLGLLPWSPLKSGLLTGKYEKDCSPPEGTRINTLLTTNSHIWHKLMVNNFFNEQLWRILDTMEVVCKEVGKSPSQVAIRWLLQKPTVTSVIIGARTLAQLEENMDAGTGWELSPDQMSLLDQVSEYDRGDFHALFSALQKTRERQLPGAF